MKFLFVHQNFPGQFLHIVRHLVAIGGHELVFITEPNANEIAGVRKVPYVRPQQNLESTHIAARDLDNAVRRADSVFRAASGLRALGFDPDIIIGHHGWGELLNLRDLWPDVPMLGYLEFYYHHDSADVGFDPEFPADLLDFPRIRAKNAINHLALNLGATGQTPTEWQMSTYPDWARPGIEMIWEGVDLDQCSPDPTAKRRTLRVGDMTIRPTDRLVTYVSRDLEPYRGFHIMMRALPALMKARKDLKVIIIGGDGVSYGSRPQQGAHWREVMLREVGDGIDPDRVVFPGRVPYATYLAALRRSDAHVYLTYPFVASWSLREALAIGCPVIGSQTQPVQEFITHGDNGLLVPFLQPQTLAQTVLGVFEEPKSIRPLRAAARAYAEEHLAMQDYLARYCAVIERLTGQDPTKARKHKPLPSSARRAARPKAEASPTPARARKAAPRRMAGAAD